MKQKLFVLDCAPQASLQRQPTGDQLMHVRSVELIISATRSLGLVKCRTGILYECLAVYAIHRKKTDSDARCSKNLMTFQIEGKSQNLRERSNRFNNILCTFNLHLKQRKLVAAKARYGVTFTDATLESFCKLLQEKISGCVAQRVVYLLKLIERDEEHSQLFPCRARDGNGLRKAIFKKSAIWKLGNAVVVSEPIYLGCPFSQQALELLLVATLLLK